MAVNEYRIFLEWKESSRTQELWWENSIVNRFNTNKLCSDLKGKLYE